MKCCKLLLLLFIIALHAQAQLVLDTTATANQLAQKLVGKGVTISNPVLNCSTSPGASATFTNGGVTQLGIPDGIFLCNGRAIQIDSPYGFYASTVLGTPGDPDLNHLLNDIGVSDTTFDACTLDFDLVPLGDTLSFRYVFASVEYLNYTCSRFSDIFAFFISGPKPGGGTYTKQNIALIPGTNLLVAINTVNGGSASSGYNDDSCISVSYSAFFTEDSSICYNGSTVLLRALAAVRPCQTYHLKMAVADVRDGFLDSGVFLEGGSLISTGLSVIDAVNIGGGLKDPVRGCADATITLIHTPVADTALVQSVSFGGSAVNGIDYTALPDSVVFPANDSLTTITIAPLAYPGAQPGKTVAIYLISTECGATLYDSAVVTILDSLPLHTGPNLNICSGDSVILSATGVPNCIWHPGATLSDSLVVNPLAKPVTTTTYTASYSLGTCASSDSTRVSITYPIGAVVYNDTIADDTAIILNPYVGSLPPTRVSYSWTPATDLSCNTCAQPVFAGSSGTHDYALVITYSEGCQVNDTINVFVFNKHILYMPTAFSPNGDGINDVLQVFQKDISSMDLKVYDRWGEKVYETTDPALGWDGTYQGAKDGAGIYVYELNLTFADGYSISKKGSITLIR